MHTWILLLRGINIGGRNILRMQALRETLCGLGLADVRTYIQSGNAVFRSRHRSATSLCRSVVNAIDQAHGLRPDAKILSLAELQAAIDANPFVKDIADPSRLFVFFLTAKPDSADLAGMERLRRPAEQFALRDEVFYLHAPEGLSWSKLGTNVEKRLGVGATARNWRTVHKLAELARSADQKSV